MEILIVVTALLAPLIQLLSILRKWVEAPRIPWIIWFVVNIMFLIVNLGYNGWDKTSLMLFASSIGNLFIVFFILRNNYSGWTKKETKILSIVIIIIIFWIPFKIISYDKSFFWATVVSQILLHVAHFMGVWVYWVKVWINPYKEAWYAWIFRFVSSLLILISLSKDSLNYKNMIVTLIPPVYGAVTTLILLSLIFFRRRVIKSKNT